MHLDSKTVPAISVIIPTFNRASLVKRAVISVLEQEGTLPLEVIILDDASSDNTLAILEEVKQKSNVPIVIYASQENIGPSKLRNKGMEIARGEYVAFLDSDDVWTKKKLKTFYADLKQFGEIHIWTHRSGSMGNTESLSNKVKVIPFWKQLLKNHASCPCTIIKKDKGMLFAEDMNYNEDHEFFSRISYFHPLYMNESTLTLLNRRVNERGGLSSSIWKMRMGEIKTYFKATSYSPWIILFMPGLIAYSTIKHIRLMCRRI